MIKVNLVADMECDRCGRPATIFQHYSGLHLCTRHLVDDIRRKGKKTVRSRSWLRPGDRIAIAMTGSFGSLALLDFMKVLAGRRRDVGIFAIIPEHFRAGGKLSGVSCVYPAGSGLMVPPVGHGVQPISASTDPFGHRNRTERFFISVAKENGATALAMPYSLLDHAEWALWRALSGRVPGSAGKGRVTRDEFRVIRPFMHIPGEELAVYGRTIADEYYDDCGFTLPDRDESPVRRILEEFGRNHPGAQFALVNVWEDIGESVARAQCNAAGGGV